ncbi:hypothetical protein U1Q18_027974 [Sarracenia purpurea var. burkii]
MAMAAALGSVQKSEEIEVHGSYTWFDLKSKSMADALGSAWPWRLLLVLSEIEALWRSEKTTPTMMRYATTEAPTVSDWRPPLRSSAASFLPQVCSRRP